MHGTSLYVTHDSQKSSFLHIDFCHLQIWLSVESREGDNRIVHASMSIFREIMKLVFFIEFENWLVYQNRDSNLYVLL